MTLWNSRRDIKVSVYTLSLKNKVTDAGLVVSQELVLSIMILINTTVKAHRNHSNLTAISVSFSTQMAISCFCFECVFPTDTTYPATFQILMAVQLSDLFGAGNISTASPSKDIFCAHFGHLIPPNI